MTITPMDILQKCADCEMQKMKAIDEILNTDGDRDEYCKYNDMVDELAEMIWRFSKGKIDIKTALVMARDHRQKILDFNYHLIY